MTDPQTFRQKWGDDFFTSRGFIQFPSALLESAADVRLSGHDFGIILALLYWKFTRQPPYPSLSTLANQLGTTPRTVQRHLRSLEDRGWIKITTGYLPDGRQGANEVDFTPLRETINDKGRLGLPTWALDKLPPQESLPFEEQ